jgi:hypothetical protein
MGYGSTGFDVQSPTKDASSRSLRMACASCVLSRASCVCVCERACRVCVVCFVACELCVGV